METIVVATAPCAWQPEQSVAVPMEIADYEIAVATRDDIPGIVDLQERVSDRTWMWSTAFFDMIEVVRRPSPFRRRSTM